MTRDYVLIVGSSNVDFVIRSERLPGPGETLLGDSFASAIGGKGANQATAARRSGSKVYFHSAVGGDHFGREIRSFVDAEGIDSSWSATPPETATGTAIILVDKAGQNSIVVAPGANAFVRAEDIRPEKLATCSHVLLSLEIPVDECVIVAEAARRSGCITVLNPAPATLLPARLLKAVDILIPNEHEVHQIFPPSWSAVTHEKAAQKFFEYGGSSLVVTLGERGAKIIQASGAWIVGAPSVKAIDTVGAGDCFCGSFVSMLAQGSSIFEAVRYATHAAALSVQSRGAAPSYPSSTEVEKFLEMNVQQDACD